MKLISLPATPSTKGLIRNLSLTAYLQLGPLDPANTAGGIPPGVLGPIDELRVFELVGAGGFDVFVHLFQSLHVGFGAKSE